MRDASRSGSGAWAIRSGGNSKWKSETFKFENRGLKILGIESSCDETAAAVVEAGGRILSSVVASQLDVHGKCGGVVPELASREHLRAITPVVRDAISSAGIEWAHLAAIAVTAGPGLAGSLLVGITYAKAIALARGLPLIGVNHVEGHIHAVVMEHRGEIRFPALALVVSGGHTHLFEVREGWNYRLLGRTRDDAAGEAYDKVAKLLGFGYPGGPVIDRLSAYGDAAAMKFTTPNMKGNALDFSFAGIKTAVRYWVRDRGMEAEIAARQALLAANPRPTDEEWLPVTPRVTLDLLASFQRAVIDDLLTRARQAADEIGAQSMIISGGVAGNRGLRREASSGPLPVFFPRTELSTDNAAMIAAAAFPKLERREFDNFTLRAQPNLTL
jgi:N6-L-threonylcarbamoyladenine synthase